MIALIDAGDPYHETCRRALQGLRLPLITTWPVLTEAMYLLGDAGGWPAQSALWKLVERRDLNLVEVAGPWDRLRDLMEKYRDLPMDLADATLVAIADAQGFKLVFTLDSHFHAYRYRGRETFKVVPA